SSDALLALVSDILDLSKIEAGKVSLEDVRVDLDEIVHTCLRVVRASDAKRLTLTLDRDPEVARFVVGDPLRLQQVVLNLLNNAVKFTDRGGVTLSVRRAEARTRFEIVDTGIGIDEKAMAGLFQPFTQADGSTSRRFGGTGLGLSIAKGIVELMG